MNPSVRRLFEELAGLAPSDRQKVLDERRIAPDVRAEVESLLSFDNADHSLTTAVASAATEVLDSRHPESATDWGPYRRMRLIGSGGMSSVYLAERTDGEIQQQVAVKVLHAGAERTSWLDRFLKERQLLAKMNHPGIARLIDAGRSRDGHPYLVMELVDGVPIDEWAATLDVRDRLSLFLRVCEAVEYAHRHLVIHRDIKPSNILVDSSGRPKLLDFGIAKLLDAPADRTNTVDRLLTPNYASPEQLRGEADSTATDVYSLGAVLYKILTGRSPRETNSDPEAPPAIPATGLPADAQYILRKALRAEPAERYLSVEALANDIRALLEWRPVQARSGDLWYRTRRFLRRHRAAAASVLLIVATVSVAFYAVNRERAAAERRFQQVRQLANQVLDLDRVVREVPGSTKARYNIVQISKEYLESLESEAGGDPELGLELANAYVRLAQTQGVPSQPNLGMHSEAKESLIKAEALLQDVLRVSPTERTALVRLAEISEALMILADTNKRDDEALTHARDATTRVQRVLDLEGATAPETQRVAMVLMNVALLHKNQHRYGDCVAYARRAIEILPAQSPGDYRANGLSLIADSLRFSGDLAGALHAITDARREAERESQQPSPVFKINRYNVLWRQGLILGADGQISLERPDEAITALQEAFDILEDLAKSDPDEALARPRFLNAGRDLADLLQHHQPERALATYDHALKRVREVKSNLRARRGEAALMAASSRVLRRLNRGREAGTRIEGALQILRETKDYPADRISSGDEAEGVLRAWGEHLAETGEPRRAAEVYQELLDKLMASRPDPMNDLRHATSLSVVYERLSGLHTHSGRPDLSESATAKRREIWEAWSHRLPENPFIQKQLRAVTARADAARPLRDQ